VISNTSSQFIAVGRLTRTVGRQPRDLEHAATLFQQQLEHAQERPPLLEAEQLLYVAGEVGVDPLREEAWVVILGQECRRQPTAQQAVAHVVDAERRQLLVQHGDQLNRAFATGEAVTELLGRRQCRRTGREDAK
jgi:hypothetical protein